jgi:hypothetical protein
MKALSTTIAAGIILIAGSVLQSASAQTIRVGPGGVRITPEHHDRWDHRNRWERRDRCRTVIERHRNNRGQWVETRRRVCRG